MVKVKVRAVCGEAMHHGACSGTGLVVPATGEVRVAVVTR